jgi:hypothetical protein
MTRLQAHSLLWVTGTLPLPQGHRFHFATSLGEVCKYLTLSRISIHVKSLPTSKPLSDVTQLLLVSWEGKLTLLSIHASAEAMKVTLAGHAYAQAQSRIFVLYYTATGSSVLKY